MIPPNTDVDWKADGVVILVYLAQETKTKPQFTVSLAQV